MTSTSQRYSTTSTTDRLKRFWLTLKETSKEFIASDPFSQAATIAYYTIFSLPAVMILTIMAAASFYDEASVRTALLHQAGVMIGPSTAEQLGSMLQNAEVTETKWMAKIIGLVALVVSAGSVFASLQSALNKVWSVESKPGKAILKYMGTRLLSLALVACFGFLMLVSLVLDAALVAFSEQIAQRLSGVTTIVLSVLDVVISFSIITLIFTLLFKVLPDVKVRIKDVVTGAMMTALLFTAGKYLISAYISYTNVGDTYGAAGAIVIILVWVYYSTIIMLFGAHYTHVHTRDHGSGVIASDHAKPLAETEVAA